MNIVLPNAINALRLKPSADRAGSRTSVVMFHRLGPYHHARLKAAGRRMRLTGLEFSEADSTYDWDLVPGAEGFDKVTFFPHEPVEKMPARRIIRRVNEVLDTIAPQAVAIPGWSDRCSLAGLQWCISRKVPAVVMSESTAWDAGRSGWKELIKKSILKNCSAGLVGGKAHADYLEGLGIARGKIFCGYDVIDNDYFARRADLARIQDDWVRGRHNLPDKYFLASARFVEKKNLFRLIRAYAGYRAKAASRGLKTWREALPDLVVLGDGPLKPPLLELISRLGLEGSVFLPGFRQYEDLPDYYGLAHAFIHASTVEPWGLVVNEAMASGLPVLVSNRCGCAGDLVQENVNGFTFDPENEEELAALMMKLSTSQPDRERMGRKSREIVTNWSPQTFADSLEASFKTAIASYEPQPSRVGALLASLLTRLG